MQYVCKNFLKCELIGDWNLTSSDEQWLNFVHSGDSDGTLSILTSFDDDKFTNDLVLQNIHLKAGSQIRMSNNTICYQMNDIK